MASSLSQVVTFTAIPVVATILGGVVAAFRPPGKRVRSYIQHFAAGIVFAAVAGELLPDLHDQAPRVVVLGFALGVGVMLTIQWGSKQLNETDTARAFGGVLGLLVTIGVDVLIDGLLIGVAFTAGTEEGIIITSALTIELLFLGLAVAVEMPESASKIVKIGTTTGLAVILLIGAITGVVVFGGLTGWRLAIIIAFAAAALLYLVTEELLVEAHEVPETLGSTSMFFVGFLTLFVIEML